MPKSVGYIGLGLMGKSIAANILKGGFHLVVHTINTQLFNAMVEMGLGELDNSAVIAIFEKLANLQLKTIE